MKKIVVAGGGVLGSQIAFQAAYCGFDVTLWLREERSIAHTKPRIESVKKAYIDAVNMMATEKDKSVFALGIADYDNFDKNDCLNRIEKAYNNIKIEIDMQKAVADADLVIESMSEIKDAKIAFFKKLAPLLPQKTIIATNSSTLLPSTFAKYTKRPGKFLALHFANSIWKNNIAEVMMQEKTSDNVFNEVLKFAEEMRMVPLPVHKEKSGYLLNSMLVPFLFAGLDLYVNGISDPESIDKAWTLGTGAPKGPFRILDIIGLNTAYNIVLTYVKIPKFLAPYNFKGMEKLLKKYIDEGKTGKSAGEGFYKYTK